jgi:hypothetical protein
MYNWLSTTYAGDEGERKIKRYVTGCSMVFGIKSKKTGVVANNVAGGRLRVFNSYQESVNQQAVNGPQEIIDTIKNPILPVIVLEPSMIKMFMESNDNPYTYLSKNAFNVICMHEGKKRYFRYDPRFMIMDLFYVVDPALYEQLQQAAKFEAECNTLLAKAQRNARSLAMVAQRTDLTTAQRASVNAEISKLLFTINTANRNLPKGFAFDVKALKANKIEGVGFVFVIPVIIWVVAIITTGIVIAAWKWANAFTEIKSHQATLDARYKSIMSITDDVARNQALKDAENTDNTNLTTTTNAAATDKESTGWLGQVKQIVIVAAIALVAKEVFAFASKSKN